MEEKKHGEVVVQTGVPESCRGNIRHIDNNQVEIDAKSDEFNFFSALLNQDMPNGYGIDVVQIKRIINPTLWRNYRLKKHIMAEKRQQLCNMESSLYLSQNRVKTPLQRRGRVREECHFCPCSGKLRRGARAPQRQPGTYGTSRVPGKALDVVSGGLNNDIRASPPDRHVGWVHSQAVHERAELVAHASALLLNSTANDPCSIKAA